MKKKYFLGKYKDGECYITWELKDGKFSMCAERWLPSKRDISEGGQCVDRIASYFPNDLKAQRMVAVWKEWHLNALTAGSPAQTAWIASNPLDTTYPKSHYTVYRDALTDAGLNPDPNYLHNGKPYAYGSSWLMRDLPDEVIAEIESW